MKNRYKHVEPICIRELKNAVNVLKNKKAAGIDGIIRKICKMCDEIVMRGILYGVWKWDSTWKL